MYISNHYLLTYFPSFLEAKVTLPIWCEEESQECGGLKGLLQSHRPGLQDGEQVRPADVPATRDASLCRKNSYFYVALYEEIWL